MDIFIYFVDLLSCMILQQPKDLYHIPLVGTGEKSSSLCGEVQYSYACEHEHRILVSHNCGSASCPVCYHHWVNKTTKRIVPRLLALYRPFESKQSNVSDSGFLSGKNQLLLNRMKKLSRYSYRHITISFPPGFETLDPFLEIRKRLKNLNLYGIIIYHPFRITKYGKDQIKKLRDFGGYQGGNWEILHEAGLLNVNGIVYFSPHVHIITSGYIPVSLERDLQLDGFVLKIIRSIGSPDVSCEDSLSSVVYYLLTHCGYTGRSKAYRYLGMYGGVTLRKTETVIEQPLECPECGRQMYKSIIDLDGNWVTDFSMPIFITVRVIEYNISLLLRTGKRRYRKRGK